MTSQLPEGVAIEQKTQPVPSSDKMALDLDINGTANRDETNLNAAATENPLTDPVPSPLPSDNVAALDFPEVNGSSNVDAFSSNQTITEPASLAVESQTTEPSSISAHEISSSNTTTEEHLPASTDLLQSEILEQSAPVDSAIDAAVEDASASTTVPLVIDAPESDLRHTSLPPAPEQSEQPDQSADLGLDFDSAQLPTPKPEKESDSTGVSAEVADLTFEQKEAVPENSLDLAPNSPLPPAPTAEQSAMQTERTTPPQATQETNGTEAAGNSQPPSLKIARERENDDEIEPAAKRAKTEMDNAASDMAPPAQNGDMEGVELDPGSAPLTPYQIKELSKILKAVSRSANGKNFRAPVAELWPSFSVAYAAKIDREVDLRTMEKHLTQGGYATMNAFRDDVHMIYNNALTFNGPGHMVTNSAVETRNSILAKIENIPAEPVPAPKRDKKAKRSTPVPDSGARDRRVSKGSNSTPNNVGPAAPTFAVDPVTNTPVIRRDSTKGDGGRPKREIHPPKSKDLVYASTRPKNKKFATELKFCDDVLNEIMKPKYWQMNAAFLHPVDPVALGIPNYFAIIKKPMDLSTIKNKLVGGQYNTAGDFEKDVRQVFMNCYKYNPPPNPIRAAGQALENLFNEEWEKKDAYMAEHSPSAATPELPESEDEDEDEEEEVEAHQKSTLSAAKELLLEHQQKLINLMSAKNKDDFVISMQQDLVATVANRVREEEEALKKKSKKVKSSKAPKRPLPPPKKSGAVKKSGPSRPKYMGTLEKETISAGLMNLPDDVSMQVLEDIKRERPGLDAEDDGTLELDIDSISQNLLWKIHGLIMKHAPEVEAGIKKSIQARESPKAPAKPPPKKKNKPMSSVDQERNISILQQKMGTLERQASGSRSQEPQVMHSVEDNESSGDDSSDSEEE